MNGWTGQILKVDLSHKNITRLASAEYTGKFLGGRGIASRLYWETIPASTSPFDPANPLIFMTGALTATGVQGATRMNVISKSPMAFPESYCYGNMGGFIPPAIKRAGFDGIIITGQSSHPVYLWLHDGKAEIRDAAHLWGEGAYRTGDILVREHGAGTCFLTTGPAGENLVRSATIFGSHLSSSCAGFGAVMGSKKLKAIAILGTGHPSVADPQKLQELNRYTFKINKKIRLAIPPIVTNTGHGHLLEVIGKHSCYQCGLECIRNQYRFGGKLEGFRHCQAMEYYLPWKYAREDEPVDTFFDASTLANDYSIDTFELQSLVDWMYACYKSGALSELETGLPLARIGTREFLEKLLQLIAFRRDFGAILAEGMVRAREKMPAKAAALFTHSIAPIGQYDLAPPRAYVVHSLTYPMEPRVHQPLIHETGFLGAAWSFERMQPGSTGVTPAVYQEIARIFWGSEEAADVSVYEGKALAAKMIQDRTYLKDSLGLCDWAWPVNYSLNTPDHLGDPTLEAQLFTAVTGLPGDNLNLAAERIFNQQRLILLREGRRVPQADYPPEYNFLEPLKTNARGDPMLVPGPGGVPVDAVGKMLDKARFSNLLQEYYRLRGWDEKSGIPSPETLASLGL
ncbi:MAG TPA: aldehyde ferredoxin oxidoreductase N-terminal domain-containing protein [Dehalococcoidales bacterium]|nr:aldehyde ferredoxin oxidoreductase N-terminal domain-containing protein [Dehalococcoidales bacterium]